MCLPTCRHRWFRAARCHPAFQAQTYRQQRTHTHTHTRPPHLYGCCVAISPRSVSSAHSEDEPSVLGLGDLADETFALPAARASGILTMLEGDVKSGRMIQHTAHSTQHSTSQRHKYSTARDTAQHSTAQHSTARHSTAQHSTAQHSTAQHSTVQHSTAQHSTIQHNTTQYNSTTQYNTVQHSTAQYSTTQHNTTQYNTIQQYNTVQHSTTQYNTTQHNTTQ